MKTNFFPRHSFMGGMLYFLLGRGKKFLYRNFFCPIVLFFSAAAGFCWHLRERGRGEKKFRTMLQLPPSPQKKRGGKKFPPAFPADPIAKKSFPPPLFSSHLKDELSRREAISLTNSSFLFFLLSPVKIFRQPFISSSFINFLSTSITPLFSFSPLRTNLAEGKIGRRKRGGEGGGGV